MLSLTNDCSALPLQHDGELSRSQQDSRITVGVGGAVAGGMGGGQRQGKENEFYRVC